MIQEKLVEIIKKYDIEKRSIESFWDVFGYYMQEEQEEFQYEFPNYNKDKLKVEIKKISYKLGNWPYCDYNHIVVELKVFFDSKNMGNYIVYFSLDGEIEDDYFLSR
ncbi:MAG: hypothetical protein KIC94_20230 [Clostridiales bacterium]|nr:hypothetical protein [Clostridiales bacterium]